jgi:drug/metabolite transporter (DMT)-like permease
VVRVPAARNLAVLALTVLVWGYNWVPLKIVATQIDPWWFSVWRIAGGALTLFIALGIARRGLAPPPGRAFILVGIVQVGGLIGFSTLALRFGGVADVTALIFTMPLFTAVFARVVLGERLSRARIGWLLVAGAGIAVVGSGIRTGNDALGAALAIGGGASWALGNVLQRRAAYRIDLLRLIAWQQLVAATPLLMLALAFGRPVAHLDTGLVAAAIFTAVVGSGIAWLGWGSALSSLPANTVALGSFAIPVIAAVSAWLQLRAVPGPATEIGLAIVVVGLCGSVLAERRATAAITTADATATADAV